MKFKISNFNTLLNEKKTLKLKLKSQMRVKGGNNYIQFVDDLLNVKRASQPKYKEESYELVFFESFKDLYTELSKTLHCHNLLIS